MAVHLDNELAASLEVDCSSLETYPACLTPIAFEVTRGNASGIEREIANIAPMLWARGWREVVHAALDSAAAGAIPGAADAMKEFEKNGPRSGVFGAVIRRLSLQLAEAAKSAYGPRVN